MEQIHTELAPSGSSLAVDNYSQAIVHDGIVYISGQIPLDPETEEIIEGDVETQTRQTLENINAVLDAADTSFENVIRTTVMFTDRSDYDVIHEVYNEYITEPYPAKNAFYVPDFAIDIDVEISVIAAVPE